MSGWKSGDDLKKEHAPLLVTSIGFEFKRDKTGITIVKGFSEQNLPLDPSFIPAGCIKKVKRIKY